MANSLLSWYGGKWRLSGWIIEHLNRYPHDIYVEPFGGGASVLTAKPPVPTEVYNDIDSRLADFFVVLADETVFERFRKIVAMLPYSRKLFTEYRDTIHNEPDIVKRAAMFFVIARQSFTGNAKDYGYTRTRKCVEHWISAVEDLPEFHARLRKVQIEHKDGLKVIDSFDTETTLFYCDPPYIGETRVGGKRYRYEMDDSSHVELVKKLLSIKGQAALSGYEHPIYRSLLDNGWTMVQCEVVCSATAKTIGSGNIGGGSCIDNRRTECLYLSPVSASVGTLF